MVHWFLYYLLQSLRLYSLCGYASPAAHVTQPRQTRMGMPLLPIPMRWGTCLLWGYFFGGTEMPHVILWRCCLRRTTWEPRVRRGLLRNHGFSRVVWLWFLVDTPVK